MSSEVDILRKSLGRAFIGGKLIDLFYDNFLKSDPKIGPLFSETDFKQQKDLLKQGLLLGIMYLDGNPTGKSGLERIKQTHAKDRMNIDPNLYPLWKTSLILAISETDSEFSPEIQKAWDQGLQKIIDFVTEKE